MTALQAKSQCRAQRSVGFALAMSAALGFSAPELRAQPLSAAHDEARPFRVAFSSTTSCRDPGEFVEQLQRRTGRLRFATATEKAMTFQIALSATPAGVEGELRVQDADGATTARQVPGLDCHEVISAMALIGALMVDPLAAAMAPPSPPRQPARPSPPPLPPEPEQESPPVAASWTLVAAVPLVTLDTGVAPDPQFGIGAFVELSRVLAEPWTATARLSVRKATNVAQAGELGFAEFTWTAARFTGCPLSFRPTRALTLAPCALFELGWIRGAGFAPAVANTQSTATQLIPSLGPEVTVAFRLVGPLVLGADFGVLWHLTSGQRFYFEPHWAPGAEVFVVPSVGISGGINLALSFF